jgi:hypothetical protein
MAREIEENISLSKERHLFTPDTLSLERLVSLETFTDNFQEEGEQIINQQEVEEKDPNEVFQSHEEEQGITHSSSKDNEDVVEELEPEDIKHDDEVLMCAPPSDEAIQNPIFPAQEEEDEVSHFPFQVFDNTLFYDSENEEEMEPLGKLDPLYYKVEDVEASLPFDEVIQILEAPAQEEVSKVSYFPFQIFNDSLSYDVESEEVLDVLTPSCYDEDDDFVDNIDEFIHVGSVNGM